MACRLRLQPIQEPSELGVLARDGARVREGQPGRGGDREALHEESGAVVQRGHRHRAQWSVRGRLRDDAQRLVQPRPGEGQFRVELIPIFGISIPVIVRHGKLTMGVAIKKLRLAPADQQADKPVLSFRIERSGERSVFGDLTVSFAPRNGRPELVLARLNGIAVYTPNLWRQVDLTLTLPNGTALRAGQLRVSYRARPNEGNKVLASAAIEVP